MHTPAINSFVLFAICRTNKRDTYLPNYLHIYVSIYLSIQLLSGQLAGVCIYQSALIWCHLLAHWLATSCHWLWAHEPDYNDANKTTKPPRLEAGEAEVVFCLNDGGAKSIVYF